MMRSLVLAIAVLACSSKRAPVRDDAAVAIPEPAPWSEAWLEREGKRFISDTAYRRAALEASLANHANTYSAQRLGAYGLGTRGWDVLPVWNPRSRPVTADVATKLERGELPDVPAQPLWDGKTPATMAAWIALGRRVFFEFPLRAEVFMEWGLGKPAVAAAVGVERTRDGTIPGLVVFANVDGESRVGITCAICHTAVTDGELVVGAARRSFDYGRLRLAYFEDTRSAVAPELAARMKTWGPGRADVTEDNDEDPVAIPDLWGLRDQTALTQAGTIRHASPLALAIRQDTQLLHTNHQRIRPPRELSWALAMFLYSLEPPKRAEAAGDPAQVARGSELFALHCRGCHANRSYGGDPMQAAKVGTDPALARGQARGTGNYRPPPLVRVADGAPYLHHGAVKSLDELLSPARLAPGYRGGRLGPGPIPGHRAGTELAATDRKALIAFLATL
ncbi:MAG TPA: cytochrome c [Kofleriaceae bacterium]